MIPQPIRNPSEQVESAAIRGFSDFPWLSLLLERQWYNTAKLGLARCNIWVGSFVLRQYSG